MKKIIYVVNRPEFLISHRLEICKAIKNNGYSVHVVCPHNGACDEFLKFGFVLHNVNFYRDRVNPFLGMLISLKLWFIFWTQRPDIVHLITIKPYLFGGLASRLARVPMTVISVAGLGSVFSSVGWRARLLRFFIFPLFQFVFQNSNQKIIVQNEEDMKVLLPFNDHRRSKFTLIRGSGLDLQKWKFSPEPDGKVTVTMASRLLKDKGVYEFVTAAKLIRSRGLDTRFLLVGDLDHQNVNSLSELELCKIKTDGVVRCYGHRRDIEDIFAESNIVCLPSYYGEGFPKVLIEAAASGRAVITTDHIGCKDAVVSGKTGLLVPVRDSIALANAIEFLIVNPCVRKEMGSAARRHAVANYDIEQVVRAHIQVYEVKNLI